MVRNVPIDIVTQLKPGRRPCNCQARVHDLIRNCLNCGKVVCAQEGSGPCFHCGNMVCTRNEQKIINAGDKKSYELLKELTDERRAVNFDSIAKGITLDDGESISKAQMYKEKLLRADKNCDVTTVNDLESDYFTVEHNAFLSAEDRERLMERKEELRRKAYEERRKIILSLDITNKAITEEKQLEIEVINDPVIQEILANATRAKEMAESIAKNSPAAGILETFRPEYIADSNSKPTKTAALKVPLKRSLDPHWCLALPPFLASQLVQGFRNHIAWKEELRVRGLVFIAALALQQKPEILNEESHAAQNCASDAIVGRAMITECLTWEEYKIEYPDGECSEVTSGFVVIFDLQQTLISPFPHTSPSELHPLEKRTFDAVRKRLQQVDVLSNDPIPLCNI